MGEWVSECNLYLFQDPTNTSKKVIWLNHFFAIVPVHQIVTNHIFPLPRSPVSFNFLLQALSTKALLATEFRPTGNISFVAG